jgi:predicted outer membrane lipoprotein
MKTGMSDFDLGVICGMFLISAAFAIVQFIWLSIIKPDMKKKGEQTDD